MSTLQILSIAGLVYFVSMFICMGIFKSIEIDKDLPDELQEDNKLVDSVLTYTPVLNTLFSAWIFLIFLLHKFTEISKNIYQKVFNIKK